MDRVYLDLCCFKRPFDDQREAFLKGFSTLGYHLVNIVLHTTSAFLVALLLRRLAIPGAALTAATTTSEPRSPTIGWSAAAIGPRCLGPPPPAPAPAPCGRS